MLHTVHRLIRKMRSRREIGALFIVVALAISLLGNTLTFYFFERGAGSPPGVWDSLWYTVISVTTIGYGDFSATTTASRIGTAVFVVIIGLAAFTTALGLLVDWVVELSERERLGMGRVNARGHLVIVNFPGEGYVRGIIEEYRNDFHDRDTEIVIVADTIERLPFAIDDVSFVRGSPLERETLERAGVAHATEAMILTTGYDDPRSDSYVASAAFVIEHMNPDLNIIAECLDPKHDVLFGKSERISLAYTLSAVRKLMVQEAQDPGVLTVMQEILSNEREGTLMSTRVEQGATPPHSYAAMCGNLLEHGVNLVGVVRSGCVILNLYEQTCQAGDTLVYVGGKRLDWQHLSELIS